ncbi:MAG: efflux transporter outer membrane subunit [Caulobacteraceae bacterium]
MGVNVSGLRWAPPSDFGDSFPYGCTSGEALIRPLKRFAPLLVSAAALAGCAIAHHRAPDLSLPTAYEAPRGGAPLTTAELDHWWLLFRDPVLDTLEDQAFALSPDARTATARLLEAQAVRGSQTAQTLPTGSLAGKANRQQSYSIGGNNNSLFPIGGVTETETLNFNVSWELDFFGRLREARKVANADFAATRFNVEGARASLAASVADDYFLARGLAIQLADATVNAGIDERLYDIARRKAALGLGASSDTDRVAGDLAVARAQVQDLDQQLHAARRQLLILVGRGIEPVENLPTPAEADDPPAIPAAVPGDLLTRRPDVREADARLRSEVGTDKLRHLAIFPTFTLLPGLGLSRTVQPGVSFIPPSTLIPAQQTTSLDFWSLGVGVNQPVLDIPRLLQDAKAEDARTEQAVIAYEKVVQTAYGEAENDLGAMAADRRRLAILEDGETRARRAYDAAEKRYRQGLDDLTAALSAEESWRNTRSALTGARVQALRRAVQTYKALGGGWSFATLADRR